MSINEIQEPGKQDAPDGNGVFCQETMKNKKDSFTSINQAEPRKLGETEIKQESSA
jgi:hypothetical protein